MHGDEGDPLDPDTQVGRENLLAEKVKDREKPEPQDDDEPPKVKPLPLDASSSDIEDWMLARSEGAELDGDTTPAEHSEQEAA